MILSVAALIVAALAVVVAFAAVARRDSRDLARFVEEKEAAWARLDVRERALDRREEGMLRREGEFLRRHADELHRLIERHDEERKELLDRIQAPHMTAAKLLPSGDAAESEFQSDGDADKAYLEQPESVVGWDPDLRPQPWDLSPSDEIPQPTVEPVRP